VLHKLHYLDNLYNHNIINIHNNNHNKYHIIIYGNSNNQINNKFNGIIKYLNQIKYQIILGVFNNNLYLNNKILGINNKLINLHKIILGQIINHNRIHGIQMFNNKYLLKFLLINKFQINGLNQLNKFKIHGDLHKQTHLRIFGQILEDKIQINLIIHSIDKTMNYHLNNYHLLSIF
jgi:hypothetical protein